MKGSRQYTDHTFGEKFPGSGARDVGEVEIDSFTPQAQPDLLSQARQAATTKIGSGTDGTVEPFAATPSTSQVPPASQDATISSLSPADKAKFEKSGQIPSPKEQAKFNSTYKPTKADPFGKPQDNSNAAFNAWSKALDAELMRQHKDLVTKAGYGWTLGTAGKNFQDSTYIAFSNYPPGTPEHALSQAITALWKSVMDARNAYGKQIGKGGEKKDFTWDELMARDAAGEDPYGTAWGGKEPTDTDAAADTDDATDAEGSEEQKVATELEADPTSDASQEGIKNILANLLDKPEMANFWEQLGKEVETFVRHLTNTLPSTVDNNYLGKKYVNSAFNKASFNLDGTLNMGDNIMGTTQPPTYNSSSKEVVVPFNYDFTPNAIEFEKNKGQVNMLQKAVYNTLGKYSVDASPKFGSDPLSKVIGMGLGVVASKAITGAEAFGGGQHVPGEIKISVNDLEKTNAPLYWQMVYKGIIPDPVQERQTSLGGTSDFVSPPSSTSKKKKVTEAVSPKRKLKRPQEFFNQADIKPEYPENPPPDMVNNKHPDLVDGKKIAKRFNRLDPISARAMPKTGNPHIDKKIVAARKKPK